MAFLTGCRVLDFSDRRGLMAGRILADLGADVVQVEPKGGSTARRAELLPSDDPENGTSYLWRAYAANKRGFEVDYDSTAERERLMDLVGAADILIESSGPKAMARLGLDWEDIKDRFPRLVYVSITGFGRDGPKADYADSDLILWAAGGPLDPHRDDDLPPVRPSIPQSYRQAAADAAAGALLALLARRKTGKGQLVDVSVQACLGMSTLSNVLAHAVGDMQMSREITAGHELVKKRVDQSGSGSGTPPITKKWYAKDGLIELHIGIGPAAGGFTSNLFKWMLEEGEPVEKFAELDWRAVPKLMESGEFPEEYVDESRAAVARFLAKKTKEEVLTAAVQRKLFSVPIYTTADLANSKQLKSRDFYVTVGSGTRASTLPGPVAKVTIDAFSVTRSAPLIGEHTEEVVTEWTGSKAR